MVSVVPLLLLATSVFALPSHATSTNSPPKCVESLVPIHVVAQNKVLNITAPKSQEELTGFVTQFSSLTSNSTTDIIQGEFTNNATYNIWTQLCVPQTQDAAKTVEIAVHGIGFDHSYWSFGGPGSKYNYVDSALNAGHAILTYDRLGVGKSDKPDGIKEVQIATEIEIVAGLIHYLKDKPSEHPFNRFIGIGHSFGSVQLVRVASQYGNLMDATILTGFSTFQGGLLAAIASFGLTIASNANPKRFGRLPSSYVVTGDIVDNQQNFFRFPNFDPAILRTAEATKSTATLGEFITQEGAVAPRYMNPVFVVTGDKDYIFCGGNCYQQVNGSNLIERTKDLFPAVANFSVFIPAETGHGANLHFSAPEIFTQIQEWISSLPQAT